MPNTDDKVNLKKPTAEKVIPAMWPKGCIVAAKPAPILNAAPKTINSMGDMKPRIVVPSTFTNHHDDGA